jgi:hypothetical protein
MLGSTPTIDDLLVGLTETEKWEKYYEAKNRIEQIST